MSQSDPNADKRGRKLPLKARLKQSLIRLRDLQGEPRYIAMGMAIGVFVAVTPTIPFHTVLALALAFILKGSKPAAVIGVWFSNPVTIPLLYYGDFKIGALFVRDHLPGTINLHSISELLELGLDVTLAMLMGGAILGIVPAIVAYAVTYRLVHTLRERSRHRRQMTKHDRQGLVAGGNGPVHANRDAGAPELPRHQTKNCRNFMPQVPSEEHGVG